MNLEKRHPIEYIGSSLLARKKYITHLLSSIQTLNKNLITEVAGLASINSGVNWIAGEQYLYYSALTFLLKS